MSSRSRQYRRKAKSDRIEIRMTKDVYMVYTESKEEHAENGELLVLSGTSQLSDKEEQILRMC